MPVPEFLKPTPWDSAVYGIETFELARIDEESLRYASRTPGHYTGKVDPLASKKLLHEFGFYYCDTLLEPRCARGDLVRFERADVAVRRDVAFERLLAICHGAFEHDRFHRDFNLKGALADARYDRWLRDFHDAGDLYGILVKDEPAAFIGLSGNKLALHAIAPAFRGRGLAKFLWSPACAHFFESRGLDTLVSSISAANLPVVNLYASLGFTLGGAVDVYHRLTPPS